MRTNTLTLLVVALAKNQRVVQGKCSKTQTHTHLKDSSDDEDVVARQRELELPGVQRVPQLPDGPGPRGPAKDPPRPRALVVEKCEHVLVPEGERDELKLTARVRYLAG